MWKRLRRRSFAPSRPALYGDQLGLVLIVLLVVAVGVYFMVRSLFG
jgi:hypothetical protein